MAFEIIKLTYLLTYLLTILPLPFRGLTKTDNDETTTMIIVIIIREFQTVDIIRYTKAKAPQWTATHAAG